MESPAWRIEGNPDLIFWPKITVEAEGDHVVLDFLVRYKKDNRVHWLCLDLHEGGRVSRQKLEQERKLKIPTVRIRTQELLQPDFIDRLTERLTAAVALLGPGELETEEVADHINREQRRARTQSRQRRVRLRMTPRHSMN